ncbi:DUF2637 domain-containing protein [Streptomyces sp. NPDC046939]|uniref:DUF2637 domain-containing protein n=1 Tax=Streptomyces sp. NPDC046939 TaxID=3155376 RepID=UPI0033D5943B
MSGRHRRTQPFIPGPAGDSPAEPSVDYQQQWETPLPPLHSVGPHWDPTEELAYLLGEAIDEETRASDPEADSVPPFLQDEAPLTPEPEEPEAPTAPASEETATEAEAAHPSPPVRRHRSYSHARKRPSGGLLRLTSMVIAALAAVTVSVVCVFGGMVSYHPLRQLAVHRTATYTVNAWPLLIYGPWIVASLSVLRAGLHRRRAAHSWAVVLLFSVVAMVLCVAQAAHRPLDAATAALPALAALVCFQQLMRQITLSRPPRQSHPRHRIRTNKPTRKRPDLR